MGNSYEYHWNEARVDAENGDRYVGTRYINGGHIACLLVIIMD